MSKMKKIIEKPYLIFLFLTLLFFLIGLINNVDYLKTYTKETTIEKDVILEVAHINIYPLIVIFLAILGFIYWALKKLNIHILTKLNLAHIILTFLGALLLLYPTILINLKLTNNISAIMESGISLIIIGQVFIVINVILGITKRVKKPIVKGSYN